MDWWTKRVSVASVAAPQPGVHTYARPLPFRGRLATPRGPQPRAPSPTTYLAVRDGIVLGVVDVHPLAHPVWPSAVWPACSAPLLLPQLVPEQGLACRREKKDGACGIKSVGWRMGRRNAFGGMPAPPPRLPLGGSKCPPCRECTTSIAPSASALGGTGCVCKWGQWRPRTAQADRRLFSIPTDEAKGRPMRHVEAAEAAGIDGKLLGPYQVAPNERGKDARRVGIIGGVHGIGPGDVQSRLPRRRHARPTTSFGLNCLKRRCVRHFNHLTPSEPSEPSRGPRAPRIWTPPRVLCVDSIKV